MYMLKTRNKHPTAKTREKPGTSGQSTTHNQISLFFPGELDPGVNSRKKNIY
jgi:hypothetical protein